VSWMSRLVFIAVLAGVTGLLAVQAADKSTDRRDAKEDDSLAHATIERAVRAMGGTDRLNQIRAAHVKAAATISGGPVVRLETYVQLPHHMKSTMEIDDGNNRTVIVQALAGDRGWMAINNQLKDLEPKYVRELKEQMYVEQVLRFHFFGKRDFKISWLGTVSVAGNEAAGVLVQSKGHRDVKIYFDRKTDLIVKAEYQVLDWVTGNEIKEERITDPKDYVERDGLKHAVKGQVLRDGRRFLDLEIHELRYLTRIDPKVFAKPKTLPLPPSGK